MQEKKIIGLEAPEGSADQLSVRMARLKRQGDLYRVGIVRAKANIQHDSRPDVMFHSALDHAGHAIRTRVDAILRPTGISVATVMPYAVTALAFLRQRNLVKPAIGVLTALAGVGIYLQHRRNKSAY